MLSDLARLEDNLRKALPPVLLVGGEEPLFIEQACDLARRLARDAGHTEREVFDVDAGFDWNRLRDSAANMSLFGDRKLVELRIPNGKPGANGAKALQAHCKDPVPDVFTLIRVGALDGRVRKSAWVSAIDKTGLFAYFWPLRRNDIAAWLKQRMGGLGLAADADALRLLVERAEGNLLSADQELQKLSLLCDDGKVDADAVLRVVHDGARYTPFDLADAMLAGDAARSFRIVRILEEEGEAPPLVLWALTRDARLLADRHADLVRGAVNDRDLARLGVFGPRKGLVQTAARATKAGIWLNWLQRCAQLDRTIKGVGPGRFWDDLLKSTVSMARVVSRR